MENGLPLICKRKEKHEWEALLNLSFLFSVYSFGIYIIARNFRSYSRGRVWAEPTKGNHHDALLVMQKNENDVYNFPTWQYCKYKDIFDSKILHIYFLSERFTFHRHKNFYTLFC